MSEFDEKTKDEYKNFNHEAYSKRYNEADFWSKLSRVVGVVGGEIIERALRLYYAARHPNTPRRAKIMAYGALAYFILPIDIVPDFIFGIGYGDDFTILTTTIMTLSRHITPEIKEQASQTMARFRRNLNEDNRADSKTVTVEQVTVEQVSEKEMKQLPKG